ncbi:riboflavin kinase/FMN adenylyltransferase [Synechococcus sp. PCC 7502]|uniref:bifunctional riboflavin kinase/FAD synthetase n=1 Tax=Synechococcus sp. PCC 7502 TaxID=1173263 RepID=UPI0002A0013C|nr:bifunctional riboflavin kinase/FAD synthetase [Synechococcus sp. PCC 7502]AFY72795.1 riboflavin kinase/FMN adenylyltransferase [Synechococcus sp. PCC 7502]
MVLLISDIQQITVPTAIALGNFDGLHRGHQRVIAPVLANPSLVPTVVTFDPHPQEFFSKIPRLLLTPLPEKAAYLEKLGIKQLVLLPFTAKLAQLSPKEFIDQILINQLHAQEVSVGFNFRFGYQRAGSVADLAEIWGDRLDIISEQVMFNGVRISSSTIREALAMGDVSRASYLLGRNYILTGTVITGQKLGRTIGFPTANIQTHPQKFLPRDGVYAVRVTNNLTGDLIAPTINEVNGVMNIGIRPTIANSENPNQRAIEIHIFNWQGDLYGSEINVEIIKFLRPERKFANLDQLKAQIKADCEQAVL